MSTALPRQFDPERLAAAGSALNGELEIDSMPRLREVLAQAAAAPVQVEMRVVRDEARRMVIRGRANARLPLVCQRCMEAVELDVDAHFALAVVADEDAAGRLPAEIDPLIVERGTEIDLPTMIEDELILALPPVPVHARVEDCGERAQFGRMADAEFDGDAKRESPFAVLKNLKHGKN